LNKPLVGLFCVTRAELQTSSVRGGKIGQAGQMCVAKECGVSGQLVRSVLTRYFRGRVVFYLCQRIEDSSDHNRDMSWVLCVRPTHVLLHCWLRPRHFVLFSGWDRLFSVLSIPCITTGTLLRLPLAKSGRQSREELQVIVRDGSVMIWALVETGPLFCVAAS
jgi:hypothetical protein